MVEDLLGQSTVPHLLVVVLEALPVSAEFFEAVLVDVFESVIKHCC